MANIGCFELNPKANKEEKRMKYKNFELSVSNDSLIIKNTDTKESSSIKVIPDTSFVFQCQKRQIRARGGAEGLFRTMKKWVEEDFCTSFINSICHFYAG